MKHQVYPQDPPSDIYCTCRWLIGSTSAQDLMAPDVISSAKAKQGYYCHSFASGSGDLPVEPIKVAMQIHLRLKPLVGGFKHDWIVFHFINMGCHPNPIDELHHFSRWLLHHQAVLCTLFIYHKASWASWDGGFFPRKKNWPCFAWMGQATYDGG